MRREIEKIAKLDPDVFLPNMLLWLPTTSRYASQG